MTARLNLALVAATILIQLFMSAGGAQAGSAYDSKVRPPAFTEFGNPETVQILGYNDNEGNSNDAMEPFISRGGNLMLFNSSNAAATTNLFWATRIDDVTTADVTGTFTLHGVAKDITAPVKLTYLKDKLSARMPSLKGDLLVIRASFTINREDFNIQKGQYEDKVANEISLSLSIAGACAK